jgi:hypothetical protein
LKNFRDAEYRDIEKRCNLPESAPHHPEKIILIERFLADLESVPWFSNIGKEIPPEFTIKRLSSWEVWPGPEDIGISELSLMQQSLFDEIMATSDNKGHLVDLWDKIHEIVVRVAKTKVPYDPDKDAWHAPTLAVWQAAWTAGLIGLCLATNRPIPMDLQEQWDWFLRGHWPSGYSKVWANERLGPLLVF